MEGTVRGQQEGTVLEHLPGQRQQAVFLLGPMRRGRGDPLGTCCHPLGPLSAPRTPHLAAGVVRVVAVVRVQRLQEDAVGDGARSAAGLIQHRQDAPVGPLHQLHDGGVVEVLHLGRKPVGGAGVDPPEPRRPALARPGARPHALPGDALALVLLLLLLQDELDEQLLQLLVAVVDAELLEAGEGCRAFRGAPVPPPLLVQDPIWPPCGSGTSNPSSATHHHVHILGWPRAGEVNPKGCLAGGRPWAGDNSGCSRLSAPAQLPSASVAPGDGVQVGCPSQAAHLLTGNTSKP